MKASWKTILGSAVFGTAVAVFGVGAISAPAQAEMVYHRGNYGDPGTLDPHYASTVYENNIIGDIFMGLMTDDSWGNPILGLAESHSVSADGKVYTFKIRDDAVWSDGTDLTAEDFVYSFRRILDPETAAKYASILYPILNAEEINNGSEKDMNKLGVKATGAKTLEVTLKNPTPYFIQLLTHYTTWAVPRHAIEKHGQNWTRPENIVSNGPFLLAEYIPQTHVKLVKNPRFYDAANIKLDTVYYHPVEDSNEGLKRFRAGELHTIDDFPVAQYAWLKENLPNEVKVAPYLGTYYFTFNTSKKPFDDVRVRRALSMAIDRETLTDKVIGTGEVPAYSFVPPGIYNYTPAKADFADWTQAKRVEEARKLLTEAGFGSGNPLKAQIRYNTSDLNQKVAIAIAAMWKGVGVEVELFNSDITSHYDALKIQDYEIGRAGWIADYNDPQNFLFMLQSNNEGFNYAKYKNAEYDRVMELSDAEGDQDKRAQLLHQAEEIFSRDQPFTPIFYYISKSVVSQKVKGYDTIDGDKVNVTDYHRSRWISIN